MSYLNPCGYYYSYKDIGNEASDMRDVVIENPSYHREKAGATFLFKVLDQKDELALIIIHE